MIKTEMFLTQLINSVVNHLTQEVEDLPIHTSQQFLVRSELERRCRELMDKQPSMGISKAEKVLTVAAALFFNGDVQACKDQWEVATVEDPLGYYEVEMRGLGMIVITAIDVSRNARYPNE